jgi:hypothetical protein
MQKWHVVPNAPSGYDETDGSSDRNGFAAQKAIVASSRDGHVSTAQ